MKKRNTKTMTRRRTKTATIPRPAFFSARSLPALSYVLIICFGVIAIDGRAQARERPKPKDYALIVGTVWGRDDRPVPGVKVKIRRAGEHLALINLVFFDVQAGLALRTINHDSQL